MTSMELKRKRLKSGEAVLEGLLAASDTGLGRSFWVFRLSKRWPQIVGASLAEVSDPVRFERGTLFVFVKSSTWLHEVSYLRDEILLKIQQFDPQLEIRDIQFSLKKF